MTGDEGNGNNRFGSRRLVRVICARCGEPLASVHLVDNVVTLTDWQHNRLELDGDHADGFIMVECRSAHHDGRRIHTARLVKATRRALVKGSSTVLRA